MASDWYLRLRKEFDEKVRGKWEPCHDDDKHMYRNVSSGRVVDSVTTRLCLEKPHLRAWAVKQGYLWLKETDTSEMSEQGILRGMQQASVDVMEDAGTVGSMAHNAIEAWLLSWMSDIDAEMPDVMAFVPNGAPAEVKALARGAERAVRESGGIPIAAEEVVGIDGVAAGTMDALMLMPDGTVELWDWKTGNHVHDDYAMQLSAYSRFLAETTGWDTPKAKVIHLSKDAPTYTPYRIPDQDAAYGAFLALSEAYDWSQKSPRIERDVSIEKLS